MLQSAFRRWLESESYIPTVVSTRIANVSRIEKFYGDLDQQFSLDRLEAMIAEFSYTTADERRGKPNPTKIDFAAGANLRTGIATFKSAVALYRKFRVQTDGSEAYAGASRQNTVPPPIVAGELAQRIGLERDMQAALRTSIAQLEPGLTIIDDGSERAVASGMIDITARDNLGYIVVIELKAGIARKDSISQILSYMGDIQDEEGSTRIRGIVVACDFDQKALSAAKMVPNVALRRYSVSFAFTDGQASARATNPPAP